MEAINKNRDKIFDSLTLQTKSVHETMQNYININWKNNYNKWDLVAMCSQGMKYKWPEAESYNYDSNMNKNGFLRLFPVKLPTWGERR